MPVDCSSLMPVAQADDNTLRKHFLKLQEGRPVFEHAGPQAVDRKRPAPSSSNANNKAGPGPFPNHKSSSPGPSVAAGISPSHPVDRNGASGYPRPSAPSQLADNRERNGLREIPHNRHGVSVPGGMKYKLCSISAFYSFLFFRC